MRKVLIPLLVIGILGSLALVVRKPQTPQISRTDVTSDRADESVEDARVIAEGLNIPWEIVFLPDGKLLATERPGNVVQVDTHGNKSTVFSLEETEHVGEGGLLGMALHPNYNSNHFVYLYTTTEEGGQLSNKVLRYGFENESFSDRTVILEGIDGAANHDGGRIQFGGDGRLYITTGDAQNPGSAQDVSSLNGKILAANDDGSGAETFSYGHRNPQGLAWDKDGNLWATEHGPSGLETGNDELNLIEFGKNYGWPTIRGSQTAQGMETPVIESGRSETWAPSGLAYLNGSLFFGGLRGETLYEAVLDGREVKELKKHLIGEFGRIRAVVVGPDGFLYISTSNRDGRGSVNEGDDKIIRINPEALK